MFNALIEKPKEKKLNLKQEMFCKLFATDPKVFGNASVVYQKVYGGNIDTARSATKRYLENPLITARINSYLQSEGYNNENVDKQHLFLINQFADKTVKMKAIEWYDKKMKRVTERLEITAPKPIMSLDDDEVIHKIDKSKAKEIRQEVDNDV